MIKRLTVEAVTHINESLLGWNHLLEDPAGLDSAVKQPFVSWDGKDLYPTLVEKAAILLRGIAANHPFFDGNKRTAWLACVEMLSLNGSPLDHTRVNQVEAGELVLSLVKHEVDVNHVALWLADRLR